MKNKTSNRGFTLIELLIVIALLGALAVGLLAALDPFEQLKKGVDTGARNTASELHGAVIRFYAIKNHMPWCDPASPTTCNDPNAVDLETLNSNTYYNAVDQIVDTGELKTDFMTLADKYKNSIFITGKSDPSPEVTVCFLPKSKSFQRDPNTKFNQDGTENTNTGTAACKSKGGDTDCYWCVK